MKADAWDAVESCSVILHKINEETMGMLQSKEEKEKQIKDKSRDDADSSNSSCSSNFKDTDETHSDSFSSDIHNYEDAEQKIDELLNITNKDFSKDENDNKKAQEQTTEDMKPEVKITNPLKEQNDTSAATTNENLVKSESASNQREELFEIQRSKKENEKKQWGLKTETATSNKKERKQNASISIPKIKVNTKGIKKKKTIKKNKPQKKKKRFFGKGSFFSKKSKDKTNQKKQATSSNPSLSNVNMIEKKPSEQSSQPQIKNDTIQQKQKPKRSSKKKFSFFSSGKKKKYKKPSTKKTDKQQMKTDVKKETKLNQEKNNDKNRSQSKKNPDSSQDQESFAQYSLDDDVKKILSITDELLAQLPDQVIEDFASSEDFQLYQKVMSKYQIK